MFERIAIMTLPALLVLWSTITFAALLAVVLHQARHGCRLSWTMRGMLIAVAWTAIGCAMYVVCKDELPRLQHEVRKKTPAAPAPDGTLLYTAKVCEQLAAPLVPAVQRFDLFSGRPMSLPQCEQQIGQAYAAAKEAVQATRQLSLRTNIGQQIRENFEQCVRALEEVAACLEHLRLSSSVAAGSPAATAPVTFRAQHRRIELALLPILRRIEKLMPPCDANQLETTLRLAVFEAQRWPGLSPQQLTVIQQRIDAEPLCAHLLLIDYMCANVQQILQAEGNNASEANALELLQWNAYFGQIFAVIP